ncbi:hypothetical protein SAMD00019534_116100 [Acytostelium subglobosum LB1]|uniref:hypothetical protein n=1 Tax=Acytostelium subglobosum LB1 TaxID=1410327 RepID=UPI000644D04E|nr:hypothetical protein SAMD00019534_116100 [Acytostelium subglobosum LB1]GAM28434.1 hypothetical protein SAMD00019534_116100 [Acytostelium subglobosum LB1]|eukprot:XP_012748751.1 hypothetical protein SAMD00019534_116100 [Acytostelium subglobosum LB1]
MSVELHPIPGLKIEPNETFLSYDDTLGYVILSNPSGFGYVPMLKTKERGLYCSDKPIRDAKFSPNGIYAATQFNDTDIELLNVYDGKRLIQSTKYKSTKGTTILGFYFVATKNDSFLIVTNSSLELYQVNTTQTDIQCKLIKETKLKIHSFVYHAKTAIILTYCGTGNAIQPYQLTHNYIEKLAKFTVESAAPLDLRGLYLSIMYGVMFCIFADKTQMTIYELRSETVYKVRTIKLLMSGTNYIHFVDNMIIVHYCQHKVSMVFDIRMLKDPPNFPISAIPMDLTPGATPFIDTPSSLSLSSSTSSTSLNSSRSGQHSPAIQPTQPAQQLYLDSWRYVSPNFLFDSATGRWFEVKLSFDKISNFFQVDTHKIIPFLQLRTTANAKIALLNQIRSMIEYRAESLESLGKTFDSLNHDLHTYEKATAHLMHNRKTSSSYSSSADNSRTNSPQQQHMMGMNSMNMSMSMSMGMGDDSMGGDAPSLSSSSFSSPRSLNSSPTLTSRLKYSVTAGDMDAGGRGLNLSDSTSMLPASAAAAAAVSAASSGAVSPKAAPRGYIIIDSDDIFHHVFNPIYEKIIVSLQETKENTELSELDMKKQLHLIEMDSKYLIAIVTEYIRSLNFMYCKRSGKLYELLISLFIDNQMYSELHRFLQYNVVEDSKIIAYKLLSLGASYPPALQLSMDMFKRLRMPDLIISTLLEKNQVLLALRFMRNANMKNDPELFLRHASEQNDDVLFYTVYKFFEESSQMDNCEKYVKLYNDKFNQPVAPPTPPVPSPATSSPVLVSHNYNIDV